MRKFNKDYDIMYHLVKNKPLNGHFFRGSTSSTYSTLRGLLVNYFDDESELIEIENQLPLLTVFVPKLPENSFSAESWDVNDTEQNPVVAIRLDNVNEVPMIDITHETEYVLEKDLIPGYPVVVIKNNERLVVNDDNHNFMKSTAVLSADGGLDYRYMDDNFNPTITSRASITHIGNEEGGGGGTPCQVPFEYEPGRQNTVAPFLEDAYNVFEGEVSQAWQGDNIYY